MTALRRDKIAHFLSRHGWGGACRRNLANDASFRRYERLEEAGRTAVLMDAPPPTEDVRPFMAIARHLTGLGYSAPEILAADVETGLLLLEDLGDGTFTRLLAAGASEPDLYRLAVDQLIDLHRRGRAAIPEGLAPYDDQRLLAEAMLFVDWYAPEMIAPTAAMRADYQAAWQAVLPLAHGVADTLVLRDFHVDNLLRLEGRSGVAACGLLDFQDALAGPVSYDLMSLLEDARRDIDPRLITRLKEDYLAAFPDLDREAFETSWAVLAAGRHAKVIGIFTRLYRRDGKPIYLQHIPRVWRLLDQALAHPRLAALKTWFETYFPAGCRGVPAIGPSHAMVLAAGLGLRMRPLTLERPKPLIRVAGRSMLDRTLDHLTKAGVRRIVVNSHWLGGQIERHLADRPGITLSPEEDLLETGGGVAKALPLLGNQPFFVCNSDTVWTDGPVPALERLRAAWDDAHMDALLLLQPTKTAFGYDGPGDFFIDAPGRARRRRGAEISPVMFAGVQILHPRLFADAPAGAFSLNLLYDKAEAAGRLWAIVHDGGWYHVGTPASLAAVEPLLTPQASTRTASGLLTP